MPEKRSQPADGVENGDAKRIRSLNGSPAPPPSANGAPGESDADRKKREIAERIAAMKAKVAQQKAGAQTAAPSASAPAPSDTAARIAAMRARLGQGGAAASPSPVPPPPAAAPASTGPSDTAARIAAMRAKLQQGPAASVSPSPGPSSPSPGPGVAKDPAVQARLEAIRAKIAQRPTTTSETIPQPPPREEVSTKARGGLGVGLHPSLMGDLAPPQTQKGKQRGGKQAGLPAKVNPYLSTETAQEDTRNDPYYDAALMKQKDRKSRQLLFNQKGKFIAQANALRQQEKLEAMKRQLQEEARKVAIEQATEKSYLVQAPPEIEWWDEGLVNGEDYEDLDAPGKLNFDAITQYVQHPILLDPPQEKNMPAPKPMYLTKKEQAKLRRQRRMADHKEEQAKIRLGLMPPPPPKVKKSNLMRVLGQEAVKDPTAVEARVNREIAQRADEHMAMNEDRKLTKEQRLEKLQAQREADVALGVKVSVYKIDNLSYGKHRFQIDMNAKQNDLRGITILHPKMNLVIVEGGAHSINAFRKLMLNRVKWTENGPPAGNENSREPAEWLKPTDEDGQLKDLSYNKCTLVWEGEEKDRAFKYWTSKVCETDGEAKDVLSRNKMENMWTLAQSIE
ncbi:U4/U5/U6 small nuclear ribonucleoprotein prp3 [Zalaria obscura]|uniref:U4/U5/U6 small nuclear ribonucleoprotein prp3 n=1 Tax=Zalaria obscura TaxID=2024903 RepID=A0ACC3SBQ6_9PEZI